MVWCTSPGDTVGLWSIDNPPSWLADNEVMGLSWWEWFKGPSVAMTAIMLQVIWTTAGTFMLMFLAALQDVPADVDEAAMMDGATKRQRFRHVTLPHLRPMLFLVITLGIIGTWQVFDQMYIMTQGGPSKTTLTPAYLSYSTAFGSNEWGRGSAIAFLLFVLIFVLTSIQRYLLRDRDEPRDDDGGAEADRAVDVDRVSRDRVDGAVGKGTSTTRKVVVYGVLAFFALVYIYPFIIQLVTSFKTDADAVNNPLRLIPNPFTTDAWRRLREHRLPAVVLQQRRS